MPFRHLPTVLAALAPLAQRFADAGHRLYLVGGIVRDQWLDQPLGSSADLDLTTDSRPETTKLLVRDLADALWTQGERFGTIGLQFNGHAVEITTHRAEAYDPTSRHPEVVFGDDIAVDLSRRDFTVNAMAIELPSGGLVDPWGGANDLVERRLRTPLDPTTSFSDDPLRMLRAARFGAKYGLEHTPELVAAATTLRDRLRIVAIERIGDELERLFALDAVADGLRFLNQTGLSHELLTWGEGVQLDPAVSDRLDVAADVASSISGPWTSRLAGFLLVAFDDVEAVEHCAARLRLSNKLRRDVVGAARGAVAALAASRPPLPSDLRRWGASVRDADAALAVACAVDPPASDFASAWTELRLTEDPANPDLLDGTVIMQQLGLEGGPMVGEAVAVLRDAVVELGPISEAAQRRILTEWWASRVDTD